MENDHGQGRTRIPLLLKARVDRCGRNALIDRVQILDRQIAPVAPINQRIQPGQEAEAIDATRALWHVWGLRTTHFREGF